MNKFCKTCTHRLISDDIKTEFNNFAGVVFLECPLDDKYVIGCTIKEIEIDWESFKKHLKKKKAG